MEESLLIVGQLALVVTLLGGFLSWFVRGLVRKAHQENCQNKVVLITGCDTGIGHVLALHLERFGFTVYAGCLDKSSEGAQRLRVEAGHNLRIIQLDVTKKLEVEQAVTEITANLPVGESGLYGLVNNAGVCVCGEFDWQTEEMIEKQISVNLTAPLLLTKSCLPLLKAGRGRVINVSSVAGMFGYPGLSIYCASKHGLDGFSQVLRLELAKFGISVVCVQPGDFSRSTQLLDSHHTNMNIMWDQMTDQDRKIYKTFFTAYHDSVIRSGFTGQRQKPTTLFPVHFMKTFEKAMLSKEPEATYMILPSWKCRLKMAALSLIPTSWSNKIVAKRYTDSVPQLNLT